MLVIWKMVFIGALFQGAIAAHAQTSDFAPFGLQALPVSLQERVERQPERFLADVAELIIGHGHDGEIDAEGIGAYVALARAKKRAYHLRRMLQGDLDGNGAVAQAELRVLQRASSARQKGLLEMEFRSADLDGNGIATDRELFAMADARAKKQLERRGILDFVALIGFDRDANGKITLEEVIEGMMAKTAAPV